MDYNRVYRHNPNVVYTEEENEALLYLAKDTGQYVSESLFVNQTARVIWKLCNGQNTVMDIINLFHGKFPNIGITTLQKDITKYIDVLIEKGLLL